MAIISFPYDSQLVDGVYDRAIKSATYRQLLSKYFTTGVFPNPSTQCQVVSATGMNLLVKKGSANINGLYVELEEDQSATIEQADTQARYDRVVLRHDDNNNVRATNVVVIKGTPSANPQPPALTRNATVYDICLAIVYVRAGATSISASDITDTRIDSNLCGVVSATIKSIDTTSFYNQIQADLYEFKTKEKADFEEFSTTQEQAFVEWFEGIKGILGEDEAGNLLNLIQENQANIEKLQYTGNIVSGESFSGKTSNKGVRLHKVVGKSVQQGTPAPESPVEIENVKITEIYSNGESGTDTSTKATTIKLTEPLILREGETYIDGEPITRKRNQVTFDGSRDEGWSNSAGNVNGYFRTYIDIPDCKKINSDNILSIKCNRFFTEKLTGAWTNPTKNTIVNVGSDTNGRIAICFDGVSTVDEWKSWLQTHPIVIEYPLKTPTTETVKVPTIPSYNPQTNVWTDNQVPTDMEWEVLAEADNSLEIQEVESNLQKPNLLDNADFKSSIINQLGKTSYTNETEYYKYGIDRWIFKGNMKVIVNDGYLRLENTSGTSYIEQYLPKEKYIDEKCILAIDVKSFNGTVNVYIKGQNGNEKLLINKTGKSFVTYTNARSVFIEMVDSSNIEIYSIKLEKGTVFTGMPQFDEAIELNKCQRYLQVYKLNHKGYMIQNDFVQQTYLLPIPMANNPTVTVEETSEKTNVAENTVDADYHRIVWTIKAQNTGLLSIFNQNVILDSNLY